MEVAWPKIMLTSLTMVFINFDFDFAHDHDGIQAQERAQILTNSVLEKKHKNGAPPQFDARSSPVLYTTSDTSKIQLLKLCSQAEVPLYFLNLFSSGLLPHQKQG